MDKVAYIRGYLSKLAKDPYDPVKSNQMTGAVSTNKSELEAALDKKRKKPRRGSAYAATV
jgi:hypothetical protein